MAQLKKARLLLVEDNPDNREVLSVLLGDRYSVSSFSSGPEALGALDTVRPDLLVLDIGMAPIDGVECLHAIRARPGYADIPAVALTAFARDVERDAFLAAGFQAVITKPILDDGQLVDAIDRLLGASQPHTGCHPTNGSHPASGMQCGASIPELRAS